MNNKIRLIMYVLIFIIFIVIASIGYNTLMLNNKNNSILEEGRLEEEIDKNTLNDKELKSAPDFSIYNENNEEIKLSAYKGKPIVINFWASWCSPCKAEMPDFNEVYEQEKDNVVFLMINATDGMRETKEKAQKYVTSQEYSFPIYFDMRQEGLYKCGITAYPTTIFINKDFKIINSYTGMITKLILSQNISKIK